MPTTKSTNHYRPLPNCCIAASSKRTRQFRDINTQPTSEYHRKRLYSALRHRKDVHVSEPPHQAPRTMAMVVSSSKRITAARSDANVIFYSNQRNVSGYLPRPLARER